MTMQFIAKQELTSDQAVVEFTSIPQTYDDLLIYACYRGTVAGRWGTNSMRLNDVAGTGYANRRYVATGTGVGQHTDVNYSAAVWIAHGAQATADAFSNVRIYIPNYKSTVTKQILTMTASTIMEASSNNYCGFWSNRATGVTSAVTKISFLDAFGGWGNYVAKSTFHLYGIRRS